MPGNQCDHSNDHQIKYAGDEAIADARVFGGRVGLCSVERICYPTKFSRPGFAAKERPASRQVGLFREERQHPINGGAEAFQRLAPVEVDEAAAR